MKMWRMRNRKEKQQQPENRIFQRKFIHMNRPFTASVKQCNTHLIQTLPAFLNYCIQLRTALKDMNTKKWKQVSLLDLWKKSQ
jgi:hypothetical protein